MPVIVATKISKYYVFSEQTLIVYGDCSYYYGSIQNKSYELPRASGRGLMVSEIRVFHFGHFTAKIAR